MVLETARTSRPGPRHGRGCAARLNARLRRDQSRNVLGPGGPMNRADAGVCSRHQRASRSMSSSGTAVEPAAIDQSPHQGQSRRGMIQAGRAPPAARRAGIEPGGRRARPPRPSDDSSRARVAQAFRSLATSRHATGSHDPGRPASGMCARLGVVVRRGSSSPGAIIARDSRRPRARRDPRSTDGSDSIASIAETASSADVTTTSSQSPRNPAASTIARMRPSRVLRSPEGDQRGPRRGSMAIPRATVRHPERLEDRHPDLMQHLDRVPGDPEPDQDRRPA